MSKRNPDLRTKVRKAVKHILAEELQATLDAGWDMADWAQIFGVPEKQLLAEIERQIEIMHNQSY